MKRRGLILFLLVGLLATSLLAGCGGGDDDADNTDNNNGGTSVSTTGGDGNTSPNSTDAVPVTPTITNTPTRIPPSPTPTITRTPHPTFTVRPPAPRQRPLPTAEPYDFELPPSVGGFLRIADRGKATSNQTGGLETTFRRNDDGAVITVTVYYFDVTDDASQMVASALSGPSVASEIEPLYQTAPVTYGIIQDKQGGYLAAWSNYHWVFLVRTTESLDVLNAFIVPFPY